MHISMWVPYDEGRLRRTLTFLSRPQLRLARVMGLVLVLLGIVLMMLDPTSPMAYVAVATGLFFVFGLLPLTVAWSMRAQA